MKIAQVAPLFESVPPAGYGGTERIVSYLTEELVALGHEVTLFASGDSLTSARLVPVIDRSLRLHPKRPDGVAPHIVECDMVFHEPHAFDIIHFHTDFFHFPIARRARLPSVTTLHGRLDLPYLEDFYGNFHEQPLISISDSQRAPLPDANWLGTVHHGIPTTLYDFVAEPENYFVFLGRISPEKRVDRAIMIARACRTPLKIAAKIDVADQAYFERNIRALFADPLVEYLGEVGDTEKNRLLGKARALLFPIDWPEPFGLVLIEAFACGTPVVAYNSGSVSEVMVDSITGYVAETDREAIAGAQKIGAISRQGCRQVFEERFTARRMALDYLSLYQLASAGYSSTTGTCPHD